MSFSARAAACFARRGAILRQRVSGVPCQLGGVGICAAVSGLAKRREMRVAGFAPEASGTARILRSGYPLLKPAVGQRFTVPERGNYRVEEVIDNPASDEWILKLEQIG